MKLVDIWDVCRQVIGHHVMASFHHQLYSRGPTYEPVDVEHEVVPQQVRDKWRRVVKALDGGVHVACVAKVTKAGERRPLQTPESNRTNNNSNNEQ